MDGVFKDFLFNKHILVSERNGSENQYQFETLFSLAKMFCIQITEGAELIQSSMIRFVSERLGENVPEPFYRGFPESVRRLAPHELLFDQLMHYAITYGLGYFSVPGHSLLEENPERTDFKESAAIRDFKIISEEEAERVLAGMVDNLLAGTRPLSDEQYNFVKEYILQYHYPAAKIASKNTAVRLLIDTRDLRLAEFLSLPDVIRLVDEMNYQIYQNTNLYKLNLRNQDRKFISSLIDHFLSSGRCDIRTCYEKKKAWNGLLHHLHYKADTKEGRDFVNAMRGKENRSVYSEFERAIAEKKIRQAVDILKEGKGSSAVLRNLNYIISRCETAEDADYVTSCMDTQNGIVLIQLLIAYANYSSRRVPRIFKFSKYNMLKSYVETDAEVYARRSFITSEQAEMLYKKISGNLQDLLKGRLGKVFIDPDMKNYALPVQENTSQGGFGVLPSGSRIPIEKGKKIRAFTYWEKVDDIDLSAFGLSREGEVMEFSWRSMAGRQSLAVTYSGDVTSGYNGGSEFFDIDLEEFRKKYPNYCYLIFCDNVYSRVPFNRCFCKAGYMMRDQEDSGAIYEPKTVQSSFLINCGSIFSFLFGIDLQTNEFVWLNKARYSGSPVAGETNIRILMDAFQVTKVINMYSFFEMMAAEVVDNISEAEVIVTNKTVVEAPEGSVVIREYDFERMIALMNTGKL